MALKPCVRCSHLIDYQLVSHCPHCGRVVGKKSSNVKRVLIAFAILGLVVLPLSYLAIHQQQQQARAAELTTLIKKELAQPQWQYSRSKLGDDTLLEYAHLLSENSVELQYPYPAQQQGYLSITQTTNHLVKVSTGVLSGQLACSSVPCAISARFDDAEAQRFDVSFPKDGSQDSVLIVESELFLEQLKHSKRLQLDLEFYQDGTKQLNFALLEFPLH